MQELRFVAVSEDGSYAVLAVPGRSGRFILSIDERLRAVAMGQTSRLAQYEIEVESPLRPKEIQARIRAGETAEEIADAAGIPVERVRWFEGPVLAERAYIADQAQAASVRRAGDSGGPGSRLGDIVPERLTASGGAPEDGQWDSRKRGDGHWQVTLTFPSGGRLHTAEWVFDPRRRHVMPDDDNAARLSLPESELPPEPVALPGEATVTPLAPRLGAAAGMGGGGFAGGGSGVGVRSFRPERSVIPDRSLGGDRSLADRPMSAPASTAASSATSATSGSSGGSAGASGSAAERPGMPERTGLAHSPAATPVLPRPSYHDHTDFRDGAAEQAAAHRGAPAASGAGADVHRGLDASASEEIVPVTAPPYVFDEPAPPRQVVFEEPEPAFLDEQLELGSAAPTPTAASTAAPSAGVTHSEPVAAPRPEPAADVKAVQTSSAQEPSARATSAAEVAVPQAPAAAHPTEGAPASPGPAAHAAPAAPAAPAALAAPGAPPAAAATPPPAADADKGRTPVPAEVPAPAAAPVPAAAAPAATSAVTAAPAQSPPRAEPAAHAGSAAEPESAAPEPATAAPATAAPATGGESVTVAPAEPVSKPAAAPTPAKAPVAPAAAAAPPQPAAVAAVADPSREPQPEPATAPADKPESAEEPSTRQRPAAKKNAKNRRSSVPSWDEIMLGSSRQRD
jgi:Protein of unknown function (DUF3071)